MGLPSEVTSIPDKKGFTPLTTLKYATEDNTKQLNLQRALWVVL